MSRPVSALLIVDAQRGLLDGETAIPNAGIIVERLSEILAAARSSSATIIHLQNDGAPGTIDEPQTAGWFIHLDLTPKQNEVVLRKTSDDGFENTELESILTLMNVTRVAVAGLLSEMCVSATIRGALKRGFEVVLVQDAHGTYDLDDIPSSIVSRVAEHALGDGVELANAAAVAFSRSSDLYEAA
jgi:nicotinamidase-related amidase